MAGKDNLKPLDSKRAAEIGAKGGAAKKGSKHISTIVRELMNEVDWEKIPVKNKAEFQKRYGKNGWIAITSVAIGQAATGDRHAREWLRKAGFGDKIDITSGGDKIQPILGGLSVSSNDSDEEAGETEQKDSRSTGGD